MGKVQRFETFTNTDLVVRVPVTFDHGAPFTTLVGAVVDARAKTSNGTIVVGQAEVQPSGTEIVVRFLKGTLPVGLCECQVWAQQGQQAAMPFVFEADVKAGYRPLDA